MNGNPALSASPYLVGPPIQSMNGFYGRRAQIESFFENLNRPQLCSQRVLGARRSGKTSFLLHVATPQVHAGKIHTPGPPVVFAYVNLQGLATAPGPLHFFQEVARAVAAAASPARRIMVPRAFRDAAAFDAWLEAVGRRFRLVVLLDEFETLVRADGFGLDFFRKLRALTSGRTQLAWVTASYRDVVTLSRPPGSKNLASPLYNVFHPDPIYMGPLEDSGAEALVAGPAAHHGVLLSPGEIRRIRDIAGDMPFYLQAAAEKWLVERLGVSDEEEISRRVVGALLAPGNLVREHLHQFWRSLSVKEQGPLRALADSKRVPDNTNNRDTLTTLENYGFLGRQNGVRQLPAGLLLRWIGEFSDTAHGVPRIFIGHGRSPLWLRVRDAVEDLGLIPVSYEAKPRVGHSIVPILREMLDLADFAILVMIGEDAMGKGIRRPRQNVVHEAGLFQGRLGFEKTVLLMENGIEFLSNLHGMQYIGFRDDDIEATFWKLSKVLRRENLLI